MKIIFAGRDNNFNRRYIKEVSREHEVVCCLFLEPDRFKASNRFKRIVGRIKKYGILTAVNEVLFHCYDRIYIRKPESAFIKTKPDFFLNTTELECPQYLVKNIHDAHWLKLTKGLAPDIIFSMCCNVKFRKEFYSIPRLGTFVLHEGLTPEYKGLHTILWALLKKDYGHIGYTLLKVNDKMDEGGILTQGYYQLKKGENHRTWSWVSHNALIEGLDDVKRSLKKLEHLQCFEPVKIQGRIQGTYTWMTLTRYLYYSRFSSSSQLSGSFALYAQKERRTDYRLTIRHNSHQPLE